MKTHKVEQLIIATVGFFWCFLMWFATAAFSPSIAANYHLSIKALGSRRQFSKDRRASLTSQSTRASE